MSQIDALFGLVARSCDRGNLYVFEQASLLLFSGGLLEGDGAGRDRRPGQSVQADQRGVRYRAGSIGLDGLDIVVTEFY